MFQFYGLPFWKNIPPWTRSIPVAIFVALVVTSYSFIRNVEGRAYVRMDEIIRIPGIYYMLLLIGWLVIVLLVKLRQIAKVRISDTEADSRPSPPPLWKEVVVLGGVVLTYVFCTFLSWILEYVDLPWNLIVFTMVYCFVFMFVSVIGGSMLLLMLIPVQNINV